MSWGALARANRSQECLVGDLVGIARSIREDRDRNPLESIVKRGSILDRMMIRNQRRRLAFTFGVHGVDIDLENVTDPTERLIAIRDQVQAIARLIRAKLRDVVRAALIADGWNLDDEFGVLRSPAWMMECVELWYYEAANLGVEL